MKLFTLKKEAAEVLQRMEARLDGADRERRHLTAAEIQAHTSDVKEHARLVARVSELESANSLRGLLDSKGQLITEAAPAPGFRHPRTFSRDHADDALAFLRTRGQTVGASLGDLNDPFGFGGHLLVGPQRPKMGAVLEESTTTAGGFAVPSIVEPQIVPLAPPPTAVRTLATVMPTSSDIKVPIKTAFGAAAVKAEAAAFLSTQPTIGQFTLSAFMLGGYDDASWELLQDVQTFQQFVVDDLLVSIAELEESFFVSGSGSGQPQGLLGNVGAGVTGEVADGSGNLLSIQSTFDVMGTLNPIYDRNASWLMAKATGIELRKAQMQTNLFAPVFVTVDGQDYLHGRPVFYSAQMPAIAAGATPVLYGDFKSGYIIGDRGGSGIYCKFLDQVVATNGELRILAYRRTDGRVRRSEAIQGITLHT